MSNNGHSVTFTLEEPENSLFPKVMNVCERKRKRETERERYGQTETDRQRQTDRDRQTETDRLRQAETGIETDKERDRQT